MWLYLLPCSADFSFRQGWCALGIVGFSGDLSAVRDAHWYSFASAYRPKARYEFCCSPLLMQILCRYYLAWHKWCFHVVNQVAESDVCSCIKEFSHWRHIFTLFVREWKFWWVIIADWCCFTSTIGKVFLLMFSASSPKRSCCVCQVRVFRNFKLNKKQYAKDTIFSLCLGRLCFEREKLQFLNLWQITADLNLCAVDVGFYCDQPRK